LTQEFEARAPLMCLLRLVHRNGSERWFEHTCTPVFDADGAWIGRRAVNRDITDRRAIELRLDETRAEAQNFFRALQHPALIVDATEVITAANNAAARLIGLAEKEIIGRRCHDVLFGTVMPSAPCPLHHCLETNVIMAEEVRLPRTGAIALITCAPLPANGGPRRALATIVDVTALHAARSAASEHEQRYASLFEDMPVALFEADFSRVKADLTTVQAGGAEDIAGYCQRNPRFVRECAARVRVCAMNACARTLCEVHDGTTLIQQVSATLAENDLQVLRDSIAALAAGRTTHSADILIHRNAATPRTVQLTWTIVAGHEATCDRVLLCAVDLTERQQLQNELILAHKARAIEALAGGIAHEFNNLLTIISGNLALMLMDMAATHPSYDKLKTMERCVEQGAELTWRLLGFAHSGTLLKRPVDANALLQRNHPMLQRLCGEVRLTVLTTEQPLIVDIDRLQIEQAMLYLLLHIVRETAAHHLAVRSSAGTLNDHEARRFDVAPGAYVAITLGSREYAVADEKVCDPTAVDTPSRGPVLVGISLAHAILKQHHGALGTVESGAGVVSYRMLLPASTRPVETSEETGGVPLGNGETILVVDDERHVITIAGMMLERLGYRPLLAQSAEEACALMEQHRTEIKAVILDIIMPDTSCEELHMRLHALQPRARFLLASGYAYNTKAVAALVNGCQGYIQKPLHLHTLATMLHETLTA
jgi:PAS domain S-box-containing protein